jgi:hypothetical protein
MKADTHGDKSAKPRPPATLIVFSSVFEKVPKGLLRLLAALFDVRDPLFMGMSNPREAIDTLHDMRQENLVLPVQNLILTLHARHDFNRLR